ncbi:hypothetical protein N7488_007835 [Penicillium malachiteum]|nr:hypothetical protein N7488_007835 [Penicillium malachiteum]
MATEGPRETSPGDLDDLFNYDVGLEDIFQGQTNTSTNDASKPAGNDSLGLGLDEEVKVTKKRQPVAKLDENRLLSQPGIPKLRRTAKTKLRFKGKGHEFSDAGRLLNFYQLWLDDLFPRAKFADGLTMIEKLGHTKRIQTMRREWIEEEKRKVFAKSTESDEIIRLGDLPTGTSTDPNGTTHNSTTLPSGSQGQSAADDDLFMPDSGAPAQVSVSHPQPDDDELEDLLREQDETTVKVPQPVTAAPNLNDDDFDDEYEVMRELGM